MNVMMRHHGIMFERTQLQDVFGRLANEAFRGRIGLDQPLLCPALNTNRMLAFIRSLYAETGIELDVNIAYRFTTLNDIIDGVLTGEAFEQPKLIRMRAGKPGMPLFFYAGGASFFLELQDLVDAIDWPGEVIGIAVSRTPWTREGLAMDNEVAAAMAAITDIHPQGPIRLAGFSAGGLFALELARGFAGAGRAPEFLSLIDSPLADHAWPFTVWLRQMARRIRGKFARASAAAAAQTAEDKAPVAKPVQDMPLPDAPVRVNPLLFRFKSPLHPDYHRMTSYWVGGYTPAYAASGAQVLKMKGLYRPTRYDGPVAFYRSELGSPIDCDVREIWPALLPSADFITVPGNHLSMMIGRNAKKLGADVSRRLRGEADFSEG